jgi:hypothetical protein
LVLVGFAVVAAPAEAHEWLLWRRALPYPYVERDPSNPYAAISALTYSPVTQDLRPYRPVEPLPWGDVNKRVSPNSSSTPNKEEPR